MSPISNRLLAVVSALVLIAAACGSDDDSSTATAADDGAPPSAEEPDESTPEGESELAEDPAEDPAGESAGTAPDIVDATGEWSVQAIGTGIKPAIALTPDGGPAIAWLTEAIEGAVFYATEADAWQTDTVGEGYFYGPIDLAFDPAGQPNIVYHDHQDTSFRPDKGDLTLAQFDGTNWTILASEDPGHDGWDSAMRFGPDGQLWAAGIEPVDFGTTDGVEFYELDDRDWTVTSTGGPPITYEFNVAIATTPDGRPVLSYYDDSADQLRIATRTDAEWADDAVPGVTGGMFSSLVVDDAGTRHVSFYSATSPTGGDVSYAVDDGSGWQVEQVHQLNDVVLGMTGARRIISLQLLEDGTPVVASTDRSGVWLSTKATEGWRSELVLAAGDKPLGQQVQLIVGDDTWHIATFDVNTPSPLTGEILYLSRPS